MFRYVKYAALFLTPPALFFIGKGRRTRYDYDKEIYVITEKPIFSFSSHSGSIKKQDAIPILKTLFEEEKQMLEEKLNKLQMTQTFLDQGKIPSNGVHITIGHEPGVGLLIQRDRFANEIYKRFSESKHNE